MQLTSLLPSRVAPLAGNALVARLPSRWHMSGGASFSGIELHLQTIRKAFKCSGIAVP